MSEENQQFAIQKIYLKDVSFESPNSPQSFTSDKQPQINVQINSSNQGVAQNMMIRPLFWPRLNRLVSLPSPVFRKRIWVA